MLRTSFKRFFSFRTHHMQKEIKKTGLTIDMETSNLVFGQDFTSHMAEVDFCQQKGWSIPIIKPMENLQFHPACSGIHYALTCFEGTTRLNLPLYFLSY